MLKTIRKILLKINCIERAVLTHQAQQTEQRYHENWAVLMRSGNTAREEDKPTVVAEGLRPDYMDTRMVGQRGVNPVFIDSVNW